MYDSEKFNSILDLSKKLETERISRNIYDLVLDEFVVNDEMKEKLNHNMFIFPLTERIKTDKHVLVRTQSYFSAKIHLQEEGLYFHRHEFVEVLYMYKGHCQHYIENFRNCVTLNEGDLVWINQNVVHGIMQEEKEAVLIKIIIPAEWIPYDMIQNLNHEDVMFDFWVNAKSPKKENYEYIHFTDCSRDEKNMIEKIMTEYYGQRENCAEVIRSYLFLLMIFLKRDQRSYDHCKYKLPYRAIENGRILQHVYEHSENITLKELSEVFSFHQSYLSRMIKENFDTNFQELVRECRIEKASELLKSTRYPVEQIAQMIGYSNAAPLYQGIKEKYGMTPAQYRRKYKYEM